MNNRWKNIILICSLLFNGILAGFIVYHLISQPLPPPHPPRLDIRREHIQKRREEIREHRLNFIREKEHFMHMLAEPNFAENRLREQLDRLLEKQFEMERVIGSNLIELRKNMDDQQAERFFKEFPQRIRDRETMLQRRR